MHEWRKPFFLLRDELDKIADWKLMGQYDRTRRHLEKLTDALVKPVTKAAFQVSDSDFNVETSVRLDVLGSLPGIRIGVASATLALTFPETYCVIDFRGWRALFSEDRTGQTFSVKHYLKYVHEVRCLAEELDRQPQEVDFALWEFDKGER